MDKKKLTKLEAAGWVEVSVQEFLGLSDADAIFVELKLRMAEALREKRTALKLTQTAAAKQIGSSQSRVAKMEAADSSVTLDLMIHGLLSLGAGAEDVAKAIAPQIEAVSLPDPAAPITVRTNHFVFPKPYQTKTPAIAPSLGGLAKCRTANGFPA